MKNIIKIMACTLIFTSALCACSSEDFDESVDNWTDREIDFHVGVVPAASSRATHSSDASTFTEFAFSIVNQHPVYGNKYTYLDVRVKGSNTEGWTAEKKILLQNNTQPLTLFATVPYTSRGFWNADYAYRTVYVDLQQTKDSYNNDILLCKKENFVPQTDMVDGKINLPFRHIMSQLTIKFKNAGAAWTSSPLSNVRIEPLSRECNLMVWSKEPRDPFSIGSQNENLCPYEDNFDVNLQTVTYKCIFPPQEITQMNINYQLDNNLYQWTAKNPLKFESGKSYTLELTINSPQIPTCKMSSMPWEVK